MCLLTLLQLLNKMLVIKKGLNQNICFTVKSLFYRLFPADIQAIDYTNERGKNNIWMSQRTGCCSLLTCFFLIKKFVHHTN